MELDLYTYDPCVLDRTRRDKNIFKNRNMVNSIFERAKVYNKTKADSKFAFDNLCKELQKHTDREILLNDFQADGVCVGFVCDEETDSVTIVPTYYPMIYVVTQIAKNGHFNYDSLDTDYKCY